MKAVLTLYDGYKLVADVPIPPMRRERETQQELEERMVREFNSSQPHAVHKVVKIHLTRN